MNMELMMKGCCKQSLKTSCRNEVPTHFVLFCMYLDMLNIPIDVFSLIVYVRYICSLVNDIVVKLMIL